MTEKILALDLASKTGVYTGENEAHSVSFEPKARVLAFWDWLSKVVFDSGDVLVDVIVIENAINQRGYANEVFHDLKAVVKLICQLADISLVELSPSRVKKVFTGSGKAEKDDIINQCLDMGVEIPYRILKSGPNKGKRRYDADAADAVAIYHTYLYEKEQK